MWSDDLETSGAVSVSSVLRLGAACREARVTSTRTAAAESSIRAPWPLQVLRMSSPRCDPPPAPIREEATA